ncbi:MAG TPA: CHAD domain-containing protein [Ktedonobacteraceae bacterium]|nr:CHAD domain-containing protein [Ktedonobacteraceae bacterium]
MAKARTITGLDCQETTGANARIIAMIRLEEMYRWAKYADHPYDVQGLHNLRIAAKRVRYTLEVFEDALPEACKPIVDELSQLQDELGAIHDSDVMIALLRLCLASQDSGAAYEQALAHIGEYRVRGKVIVPPDLVANLVEPSTLPTSEERYGLEQLLQKRIQHREDEYNAFRQHWHQLEARDFRREILEVLDS